MPEPTIAAEAVEAFRAAWSDADTRGESGRRVEAGLRAALPFLPQHVSPSVEDVRKVLSETESRLGGQTPWETVFVEQARAVLALLSAPTVAQVQRETREQVAQEIKAREEEWAGGGVLGKNAMRAFDECAAIARAAEVVDPRG